MPEPSAKTPMRASLLDRLRSTETMPALERGPSLAELKRAVRDDLEKLLNARRRCQAWPSAFRQLEHSLVNYGIPDFTSAELSTDEDREQFRRALEETIRQYEPRLKPVRVTFEGRNELERTLRFRIDAVLLAEPVPEPVVFNSALEPMTGEISVQEGER